MKKWYKLLAVLFAVSVLVTACGQKAPEPEEEIFKTYDDYHNNITVGISVGEEGYYSTYADVVLHYYRGNLADIEIIDPTLLAFKHSEDWDGGYYVYDYTVIQEIITVLRQSDDPQLQMIADELEHGLLMTEAST